MECTHSLTQQVKKKKRTKKLKPFGNQEGERDCYLNSIAPKRKENTGGFGGGAGFEGRLRILLFLLFLFGLFVFIDVIKVEMVLHVRLLRLVHGV